jgi:hypothetical protein
MRMGRSREMEKDLRHIEMYHKTDPKCTTYEFLREALDRALERQRQRRNTQEQRDAALRNLRRLNGKAMPGEVEDKPPKKDKKEKKTKHEKRNKKDGTGNREQTRSPSASGRTLPKERYVSGTPDPKICCWYFNHGDKCKKGKDECPFLQMSPGKDKLDEIPNGKGKGSGKNRAAAPNENGSRNSSRGRDPSRHRRSSRGRNKSQDSRKSS